MSKVVYYTMASLDGYIEGPDREIDWAIIEEELHTFVNNQQAEIGGYLYGRRMYEIMTSYWPTADQDPSAPEYIIDFAHIWKDMPKIVFSKTLEKVEWNSRLVRDDITEEIPRLKAQPGKDLSIGGAKLASTFFQQGWIDEYRIFFHPVILGSGTPMFPVLDSPISLRLLDTHIFGSGVVYHRYQNDGK